MDDCSVRRRPFGCENLRASGLAGLDPGADCGGNVVLRSETCFATLRFLKLHREGHRAAEIGHIVIEHALVRLACCQRTDGAHREIFITAIVCGYGKNFADVISTSLIILPHHEGTNCVDEKRTCYNRSVTK